MQILKRLLLCTLLLVALVGCGGGGGSSPASSTSSTGSVTGTLTVSNLILPAAASISTQSKLPDIVPGEIIIHFKDGINEDAALSSLLDKYKNVG